MKQEGIFYEWTNDESTLDNEQKIINSETSNDILGVRNKRWRRRKKKMLKKKDFFEKRTFSALMHAGEIQRIFPAFM